MNEVRSPIEMAATRQRSLIFAGIGASLAVLMLALSSEFLALHCVILVAVTLSAGISCARVAISIRPDSYRRAGLLAGVTTAIGYASPFILLFVYRAVTIDSTTAARLAAELSAAQATELVRQNIIPGVEYFRAQYISYIFGYVMLGLLFGGICGTLGGILARRNTIR